MLIVNYILHKFFVTFVINIVKITTFKLKSQKNYEKQINIIFVYSFNNFLQ